MDKQPWSLGTRHPTRILFEGKIAASTALPDDESSPSEAELEFAHRIVSGMNSCDELLEALHEAHAFLDQCLPSHSPLLQRIGTSIAKATPSTGSAS